MGLKDYLPNFTESLNTFYDEKLKTELEQKSTEYKELITKHLDH
jgi:hypothetical protein